MYTLWPIKRAEQDAAQLSKAQAFVSPEHRKRLQADRVRAFRSFLRNGVLRIAFFFSIPAFFFLESAARRRWSRKACLGADEWCEIHTQHGISDAQIRSCVGGNGMDFLLEYCKDCHASPVVRAHCPALAGFASECAAQCNAPISFDEDIFFQASASTHITILLPDTAIEPGFCLTRLLDDCWDNAIEYLKSTQT
ncbi:MAG: hypothetical protein SGPRY_000355 [Prymnesium sp.]